MLQSCNNCHKEYVASNKSSGEHFICSKCQGKTREHSTKLGIHPALEKKLANQSIYRQSTQLIQSHIDKSKLRELNTMPNIPGFDIAYQIGRGAMGSVYRARQIKTGRLVAIKVLSHELSQRSDLVARFEREAYALKSLNDRNVVTVIDAGHIDDIHYLAMEFIDGITLRTRINRGTLDLGEAAFVVTEILNALKAAHQQGIIHRDLKPENVLLAYSGSDFSLRPDRVVVVDFGLVGIGGLAFDPHPNLTRSKVTMGTVNYMAPEQHVDAKRVDQRSDLYSAGVILFEMLTGELPLGRYLMPSERGMNMPPELDALLACALARNPEARFASADQFLLAIKKLRLIFEQVEQSAPSSPQLETKQYLSYLSQLWPKSPYALLILAASICFAIGIKLSL